ncbi:hypothetical protein [Sphingomonas sp. PAMC 26605]|uniref:hypothetical protein n=1 Tax=Sphingomonas sp. PAMC 26605 TaxID=1112214 RepID=UPI00026CCBB6|nr:hypothetical protein [Sphingomonas sp. PAMC 26605]
MRFFLLSCLALSVTACAAGGDRPAPRHGPPGGRFGDHRGPGNPHGGGERGPRGRLFVSPMGEPFRAEAGGIDPETRWFEAADTNHDGVLSPVEFSADAMRFFALLDRAHDGEVDPDDIDYYESELLPEVRVAAGSGGGGGGVRSGGGGGRGGGRRGGGGGIGGGGIGGGGRHGGGAGQGSESGGAAAPRQPDDSKAGAARYGLFDYPEPITPLDTNFNRGISAAEFQAGAEARFALLDRAHAGVLHLADLPRVSAESFARPHRPGGPRPARDEE